MPPYGVMQCKTTYTTIRYSEPLYELSRATVNTCCFEAHCMHHPWVPTRTINCQLGAYERSWCRAGVSNRPLRAVMARRPALRAINKSEWAVAGQLTPVAGCLPSGPAAPGHTARCRVPTHRYRGRYLPLATCTEAANSNGLNRHPHLVGRERYAVWNAGHVAYF